MVLVSLTGGIADFGWGLALGFALSLVVLASLLVVATFPQEALQLAVSSPRGREFKGGTVSVELFVTSKRGASLAVFDLTSVPDGLDAAITGEGLRRTLEVKSRFAGVFSGLKARVGVLDPLGIFSRSEVHELKFSTEFLPTFLLVRREPLQVSAAILGDYPAGRSGFGQEFYSAQMYAPGSSSRDILWKRQAKSPNGNLMARVGEANIPEKLTVCFVERRGVAERKSPQWMDLASEAIARVGLPVISSGTTLRLLHVLGDSVTVAEAKDAGGLANVLVDIWREDGQREKTGMRPGQADIIVTAEAEISEPETMGLVLQKPSVLLGWGRQKKGARGSSVVFFSGHEDVSGLVARVLSR